MTLAEAKRAYLDKLRRNERPESTIDTYSKSLRWFIDVVGDRDVSALTTADIERYDQHLYDKGLAAKSRRNRLAVVRGLVRFMYIRDWCALKPEQVELPEIKHIEANFLTREEARKLVSVVTDDRDRAMVLCLLTSWVRISELLAIQIDDWHKQSIIIRRGKGGKPRPVYINRETERAIKRYVTKVRGDAPGALFLGRRGNKLSREWVGMLVRKYAEQAGIKKRVSNHTLRHTGATGFLEDGGQLEVAQKILGHTNIRTTMIYLHFSDSHVRDAYTKATPQFRYTRKTSVKQAS